MIKVTVPAHPHPIQFKALNRKFGRYILQIIRGSNVCDVVQEPVGRLDLCFYVYALGPEALSA